MTIHPATEDCPFTVVTVLAGEHAMRLRCYYVTNSGDPIPEYEIKGGMSGTDVTTNIDDARLYLSGHVRWDGCSNLRFDEQDHVNLHFCGRSHAAQVGKLLDRLYDIAAELIPTWDGDH